MSFLEYATIAKSGEGGRFDIYMLHLGHDDREYQYNYRNMYISFNCQSREIKR